MCSKLHLGCLLFFQTQCVKKGHIIVINEHVVFISDVTGFHSVSRLKGEDKTNLGFGGTFLGFFI